MMKAPNPNWESSDPLFAGEEVEQLLRDYVEWDESELKCECGSESCGSPKHSAWCPKSESE